MANEDLLVDEEGKVVTQQEAAPQEQEEENEDHSEQAGALASGDDDTHENEQQNAGSDDAEHEEDTGTDAEREAIRERRRLERKQKKEAQREREDNLRRELEMERQSRRQLEDRLSVIERKATGMETSAIDQHMKQANDAYTYFKNQIAVASAAGDHAAVADATEKMILARERVQQLDNVKKAYTTRQQQAAPLDPRMAEHAQRWLQKNNWYDPDMGNDDSRIAKTIDEKLAAEGWNPTTPAYWDELDSRLKKYLPHRYKKGYNGAQQSTSKPRSPVSGSGREAAGAPSGAYRLSAERVRALKDVGINPGTPEFAEQVKYFKEYDKQQSAAGN